MRHASAPWLLAVGLAARAYLRFSGIGRQHAEDPLLGTSFTSVLALDEGWHLWTMGVCSGRML